MAGAVDLPEPYCLVSFDEIDSTNAEAVRQAAGCAADGTVVWAKRQSGGKGRRGRTWVSEEGNFYGSLLLRPDVPMARCLELTFVAANAVADTVASVLPDDAAVRCKWPNDVLVNDHKVAGILLESGGVRDGIPDWLVVGVGINVDHHPQDTAFPATNLTEQGAATSPEALLSRFCAAFQSAMVAWRQTGFADVRKVWMARAWGVGAPLQARLENETVEGVFEGLADDGSLILATPTGARHITAGDVFPARI